jgi:hypothetical protein
MNAYGLPALGMAPGMQGYPMFPGAAVAHQQPQQMMMFPQPSPTAAAAVNRAPVGPPINEWAIHVPMGPAPPASSASAAAPVPTQPVLLRVKQVLATLTLDQPPNKVLGKKTTPVRAGGPGMGVVASARGCGDATRVTDTVIAPLTNGEDVVAYLRAAAPSPATCHHRRARWAGRTC